MSHFTATHTSAEPSEWVCRWASLIKADGCVLDVACGFGRNLKWLHSLGLAMTGVDRSAEAIEACKQFGDMHLADIENGPWPFMAQLHETSVPCQFDAVVVCNYLWRPLMPTLLASVKPGGVLLYETFAQGNEKVGKPSRSDFLLRPGELLDLCDAFKIVAYEDVFLNSPARYVQRIAAIARNEKQ